VRLEHSLLIHRPVAEVFAFVADPDNLPRWQSGLLEVEKLSGDGGVGSRHREVRSMLGRRIEQVLEITALTPDRRLDLEVIEGPMHLSVEHTFEPVGRGTRITVVGHGEPGTLSSFAGPLITRAVKKQSQSDFARLRKVLEADGA
jgi:carbon monoxide dehydrogenase subunit G